MVVFGKRILRNRLGRKDGNQSLKEIWRSVFYHPELDALLVVYVDDLKLAAPTKKIKNAWKSISSMIDIDDPEPFNRYFGCEHREERERCQTRYQRTSFL